MIDINRIYKQAVTELAAEKAKVMVEVPDYGD